MKQFSELFHKLDQTTKTNEKVKALVNYFNQSEEEDIVWAIALLSGKQPKKGVKTSELRTWSAELANIPLWLLEESYHIVGDLSETISLILPAPNTLIDKSLKQWMSEISKLHTLDDVAKETFIKNSWMGLEQRERFVFNKLLGRISRIGVSQKLMVKALSQYSGMEENALFHRLMGDWSPEIETLESLIRTENPKDNLSKPYPFYLAYALENEPEELGNFNDWQIERKWDGIRGQIIVRENELYVWSRGEELMTDKFPEYENFKNLLPNGTVLDGEILAYKENKPLDFNFLQTRIGRKNLTKSILEKSPVVFYAYDLLELDAVDIRSQPLKFRREKLEELVSEANHPNLILSEKVVVNSWDEAKEERAHSRNYSCEGLMLKHKNSDYKVGRKRGDWWKWKVDPMTIDAVLIYAMRGHGRRANLYTDYTFAVWDNNELVPFTKAYSGLTDKEFKEVDRFVKSNTSEKFGPVRSVTPELVFEIAFEGIAHSSRHKSGVALRFPRMKRWRKDKTAKEANTKDDLLSFLS